MSMITDMGVLNKEEARSLYDNLAGRYDLLLLWLKLFGLERERKRLINALRLEPGDHVVDLCAGTGRNLPLLVDAVGPTGWVTAVDLSEGMLDRARSLAAENGWSNVVCVQADVETYAVPHDTTAVLSTFGLEMVPDYDGVIGRAAATLRPGARLGLMGLKYPEHWPSWLVNSGMALMRPFGVSRDYRDFCPWISAEQHLKATSMTPLAFGAAYRCIGTLP